MDIKGLENFMQNASQMNKVVEGMQEFVNLNMEAIKKQHPEQAALLDNLANKPAEELLKLQKEIDKLTKQGA